MFALFGIKFPPLHCGLEGTDKDISAPQLTSSVKYMNRNVETRLVFSHLGDQAAFTSDCVEVARTYLKFES